MSYTLKGPVGITSSRDKEGHREYKLTLRVSGETTDGLADIYDTPGLPLPGSVFGSQWDGAGDSSAYCTPEMDIKRGKGVPENTCDKHFDVTYTFSTRPMSLCQDYRVDNPLLQPPKISRSYSGYSVEATRDSFGRPILTSSHEQVRGSQVEWEEFRSTMDIEFNALVVDPLFDWMNNTVNAYPLWGYPRRSIRYLLKGVTQNYYGNCAVYYTLKLAFELFIKKDPETGVISSAWDRDILDEGTKALSGEWTNQSGSPAWKLKAMGGGTLNHPEQLTGTFDPDSRLNPDPNNPAHFIKYRDPKGEFSRVVLDGQGLPYNPTSSKLLDLTGTSPCGVVLGDCTQVPEVWTVLGAEFSPVELTFNSAAGCQWRKQISSNPNRVVTLQYNAVQERWELYDDYNATPLASTLYTSTVFACKGPNTFTKQSGPGPDVVTLVWRVDKPGSIHVEKLQESNFLLLGIPLSV